MRLEAPGMTPHILEPARYVRCMLGKRTCVTDGIFKGRIELWTVRGRLIYQ